MTKASDNDYPSLLLTEQSSAPTSPAASHQRMYIRTSDHALVTVNSSGTVAAVGGGAGTLTTVKDEGSNLSTAVASLDFVGAGVTATGTTAVTVTIPGGGSVFKYTVRNSAGNLTTTSTSKVAMDATNLAFLTFTLAVGDVVRCKLVGMAFNATGSARTGFDFEVDQPTSANVFIAAGADYGVQAIEGAGTPYPVSAEGMFVATEAGSHGFRPAWVVSAGTGTMMNAASGTSDITILFSAEKLGPVTP